MISSKFKDKLIDIFDGGGCWLVLIVLVVASFLIKGCGKREATNNEVSHKGSNTSTTDSINWEQEVKKFVLVTEDDSMFHYSTNCELLHHLPEVSFELLERNSGKIMCPLCGIKEAEYVIHKDEYLNDLRSVDEDN